MRWQYKHLRTVEQVVDVALRQPFAHLDGIFQVKFLNSPPGPLHLAVAGDRQGGGLRAQPRPRIEQPECALVVADATEENHTYRLARCGLDGPGASLNCVGDYRYPRVWRDHLQPGGPRFAERDDGARPARASHGSPPGSPAVNSRRTPLGNATVHVHDNGHAGEPADPQQDPFPDEARVACGVQVDHAGRKRINSTMNSSAPRAKAVIFAAAEPSRWVAMCRMFQSVHSGVCCMTRT